MLRTVETGQVVNLFEVPHRVRNEMVRLHEPLEDMGEYEEFRLLKMAEIILGHPNKPIETLSVISAHRLEASFEEHNSELWVVDKQVESAIRESMSLDDIEVQEIGTVESITPNQPALPIGRHGEVGHYLTKLKNPSLIQLALTITNSGLVDIEGRTGEGTWVHANWQYAERTSKNIPVALAATAIGIAPPIPLQRNRLS